MGAADWGEADSLLLRFLRFLVPKNFQRVIPCVPTGLRVGLSVAETGDFRLLGPLQCRGQGAVWHVAASCTSLLCTDVWKAELAT